MWIKERDKRKAAFMMLEELFESMIIFFRLTNSLATFRKRTGSSKTFLFHIFWLICIP